jgi:nicotinate phosphoribosyltransferase
MAQLYFRMGLHDRRAQFDHFFRSYPNYGTHQAGLCVNAGLGTLLDWMSETRFTEADLEFLAAQRGRADTPLFGSDFLDWLRLQDGFGGISIRAIPEGRVVHPNVPLTVVQGPLAMAQVLETPLLNFLNYQTLIATKAARVVAAARGRPVMDFGLRRGPAFGANAGTRAAMIGGVAYSSNVATSNVLGSAPKGTHGHSMVQMFLALGEGELAAFRAYADVYPDDCVLLVDSVDTLESGIPNAITVFEELKRRGHRPAGIRLDSGDLAYLSIQAAAMLDKAGFSDTSIVLSSGLDELAIWQILTQIEDEAPRYGVDADHLIGRLMFGVGGRLLTSYGDPLLDGVYKAVAIQESSEWIPAMKRSENVAKVPAPGVKDVWRLYDARGRATADVIGVAGADEAKVDQWLLHHPVHSGKRRVLGAEALSEVEALLVEVVRGGERVDDPPTLDEVSRRRKEDLRRLDPGVRRLINPHVYHVSLTERLWQLKQDLSRSYADGWDVTDD